MVGLSQNGPARGGLNQSSNFHGFSFKLSDSEISILSEGRLLLHEVIFVVKVRALECSAGPIQIVALLSWQVEIPVWLLYWVEDMRHSE